MEDGSEGRGEDIVDVIGNGYFPIKSKISSAPEKPSEWKELPELVQSEFGHDELSINGQPVFSYVIRMPEPNETYL